MTVATKAGDGGALTGGISFKECVFVGEGVRFFESGRRFITGILKRVCGMSGFVVLCW